MVELDPTRLPRHVAVIMDGNGRWAEQRGLSRLHGHRVGKDSVRAVVETSRKLGIPYLSLYAFSTENWYRPPREVDGLMALLRRYLATELGKMMKHQIRLLAVGSLRRLPPPVREALRTTIAATRRNRGMTVTLAISYGAREEIARATRAIARRVRRGELHPGQITAATVAEHLHTKGIPDPDLLIRTSGEMRLSNFFLWQLAYTEIYVTDTLWPDFREREYLQALAFYQQRERRFGRVSGQLAPGATSALAHVNGHGNGRARASNGRGERSAPGLSVPRGSAVLAR
ncbi:MAG TPA: isoprenyl transferase [Candidatus Binatia bacterium]|nr:isoprenyl transferase [Candidatus Binatia bacterium]